MRSLIASGQAGFEAKLGMGLGWKVGEINGRRFYNHEGSGAGFTTETRIYPDENLGIVLMMNDYGVRFHHLQHRICEAIRAQMHQE
jgi:CubicO group peptidase (beta-lactamase class C family)